MERGQAVHKADNHLPADCQHNLGATASHNPTGLHGLSICLSLPLTVNEVHIDIEIPRDFKLHILATVLCNICWTCHYHISELLPPSLIFS
jgi:hypothetical protein